MPEGSAQRREIYLITKSEDRGGDKWRNIERVSKVISIAAIPVVLAVVGWVIQADLQNQTVSRDYVQLAVSVLRDPDKEKVPPELRDWAVDLLNENSPTKFSAEVTRKLKSGETILPIGSSGTVTTRADKQSVYLNFKDGERLRYRLKVEGATPLFNLSSSQRTLWSSEGLPPSSRYERMWPRDDSEIESDNEILAFAVSFIMATKFTLTIERLDKSGNVLEVIKNKDYQSENASDNYFDTLRVVISR